MKYQSLFDWFPSSVLSPSHHDTAINASVYVHQTLHSASVRFVNDLSPTPTAISLRHYLDSISQLINFYHQKQSNLEKE